MYITYSYIVANDHKRHQQHSSQYFRIMLHQVVDLFGIHGVSKRNAPLVSCRYFRIMLHQVVDMFGIHGVYVTLLEVINIFKLCCIKLLIFLDYMECPKKCAICKLLIYLDNAASICCYFWNKWGVCDTVMDITRFCFVDFQMNAPLRSC